MLRSFVTVLFLMAGLWLRAQKPAVTVNKYAKLDASALLLPDSLTSSTDKIAGYINAHFGPAVEKTRAVFIWVANNIQYDVDNMFAINFYEQREEKIAKPLRTRKGICENYASLFTDICQKAGIHSVVVEGYTKQRGFVDYIPHAWCAAEVDGAWFLFDPTWGSGYINNGKFVKRINNEYFKAKPETFIKSHIPFDYLWEFLYYPVTNQEFYEGKTSSNPSKPYFNYPDSIRVYEALPPIQQEIAAVVRVEKNGLRNSLVFDRLQHLKLDIENNRRKEENDRQIVEAEKHNKAGREYDAALSEYNSAVNRFNDFINYHNVEFKPEKPDQEIQAMIDTCDHSLKMARSRLSQINTTDTQIQTLITTLNKSIDDLTARVVEQQEWLKKYFSKGKMGRKSMFRKYTWFGLPLN